MAEEAIPAPYKKREELKEMYIDLKTTEGRNENEDKDLKEVEEEMRKVGLFP